MSINQRTLRNWRFATLAAIKAVANANDKTVCFCDETATLYKYDPTSGATADDEYILATGAGGTTRWVGVAGKYVYALPSPSVGEIFVDGNAVGQTLTNASQYYKITQFDTAGEEEGGVTNDVANDKITVDTEGLYSITFSFSFSGTVSKTFIIGIYVDGVLVAKGKAERKLGTGGDVGAVPINCVKTIAAAKDVDVRVQCTDGAGSSFVMTHGNLNIKNVSGGGPGSTSGIFTTFEPAPNLNGSLGDHSIRTVTGAGNHRFNFKAPPDFVTLVSLKLFAISPNTDAGADIDIDSDYGKVDSGEDYNNHSEARDGAVTPTPLTANVIVGLDVSDVFSNLEAGDVCGFNWNHQSIGFSVRFWGVELRYTK